MILVGIDIGKLSHMFCVMGSSTGEFLVDPISFKNNKQGFDSFMNSIKSFSKSLTIKMVTQQFEQCIRHQNYDTLLTL